MRDLYHNLSKTQMLAPATLTTDTLSAAMDLQDAQGGLLVAAVGASGDTLSATVYVLLEVQHSADNITYEACANADLTAYVAGAATGTFAKIDDPAEDATLYSVGYRGGKRYLKVNVNLVGTHTNGIPVGVVGLASPNQMPVA